jgi:photosystem II stability/assembly factor-like uncharacterized protein
MRTLLLVIVCGAVVLAGCGGAPASPAGGSATPGRESSTFPGSAGQAAQRSGVAAGSQAGSGRGCPAAPVIAGFPAGIQFVSASLGWAVSQDTILATTDGGRNWTVQYSGHITLTSVDFISSQVGWAVGTSALLATSDGGARWTALPEPCPVIRSVHFISPDAGFAVAGGTSDASAESGPEVPEVAGVVLMTSDGGRRWRVLPAPANAQTVCFSDPQIGWLGAGGRLYRSTTGGRRWVQVVATPVSAGYPTGLALTPLGAMMIVQCAGAGSAWALDVGELGTMEKQPYVGYHAGPAGAVPIFADQYFPQPGVPAPGPGPYAGPFSAISPSAAAFIGWCAPCGPGPGTAPWDLVTGSGASLTPEGNVGGLNEPEAASFVSPQLGWVIGLVISNSGTGVPLQRQRILVTDDAGRAWHDQYTG